MNSITKLSVKQLLRAAALKQKIQSLESQLMKLLGSDESAPKSAPKKRRKMSKAAKAKIAAAQRARWAKAKGKKSAATVKKARRKLSVAARAKIAAVARARWKKAKTAGKKRL